MSPENKMTDQVKCHEPNQMWLKRPTVKTAKRTYEWWGNQPGEKGKRIHKRIRDKANAQVRMPHEWSDGQINTAVDIEGQPKYQDFV